jgi:hypothetical protein
MMLKRWKQIGFVITLALAFASTAGFAAERGTVIREAALYSSANANSQKVAQVERGRALTVLERSDSGGQGWARVSMAADETAKITREISGWLPVQALITATTANGDQVVFGQAVASEHQAEERGGRKGAAEDAMRLYARVPEMFPGSALAAEGLWRSADIRWQLAKADFLRSGTQPEERYLNEVIAKFPQSKQADLAAYDLLEAKLCPEWRGLAECQAALVDIYRIDNNMTKSDAARKKAAALAQQITSQFAQSEWKPRAVDLVYKLEKKIPIYGQVIE